jgi:biopolymer transport protein ExbD
VFRPSVLSCVIFVLLVSACQTATRTPAEEPRQAVAHPIVDLPLVESAMPFEEGYPAVVVGSSSIWIEGHVLRAPEAGNEQEEASSITKAIQTLGMRSRAPQRITVLAEQSTRYDRLLSVLRAAKTAGYRAIQLGVLTESGRRGAIRVCWNDNVHPGNNSAPCWTPPGRSSLHSGVTADPDARPIGTPLSLIIDPFGYRLSGGMPRAARRIPLSTLKCENPVGSAKQRCLYDVEGLKEALRSMRSEVRSGPVLRVSSWQRATWDTVAASLSGLVEVAQAPWTAWFELGELDEEDRFYPSTSESFFAEQGLSRTEFLRTLNSRMGAITRCYDSELMSHPDIRGRVVVRFVILPSGLVRQANGSERGLTGLTDNPEELPPRRVELPEGDVGEIGQDGPMDASGGPELVSSSVGHAAVEQCLLREIGATVFPRASNGKATTVTFPFLFRSVDL